MKALSETQKMEYKNSKKCHICVRYLKDTPPSIEKNIRILNKKIDIACKSLLWIEKEDKFEELGDKARIKYEKEGGHMNTFYENYIPKLKNIKLEDEEKLNKLIEFVQNRKIVDKARIKHEKKGGDLNTFYENYIIALENVENEYEDKCFNKVIEFVKNRKYNIEKKEELNIVLFYFI